MEHDDELKDLKLQFQALQKQQEKKILDRKKDKETDKLNVSDTQDDLDLSKQGVQEDRWVLQRLKQMFTNVFLSSCQLKLLFFWLNKKIWLNECIKIQIDANNPFLNLQMISLFYRVFSC